MENNEKPTEGVEGDSVSASLMLGAQTAVELMDNISQMMNFNVKIPTKLSSPSCCCRIISWMYMCKSMFVYK